MSPSDAASIDVLYVDDDEALLSLTGEFLERRDEPFAVDTTSSPREALAALRAGDYDAVVSDYQMPEMDGIELLEAIREDLGSDVPFVIFTGRGREEVAIEALNLGADRYLQKGGDPSSQYGVLAQAIEQEVEHFRTRAKLREREEHLRITLESIGDAVIATDDAGTVTRMNDVAERLTGWDRSGAIGRPVEEVFDIRDQESERSVESPVERVLREGQTVGLANGTLLVGRNGERRYIADSGAPIETEDGDIVGVVLVFRDVTERYRRRRRRERQREALLDVADDEDVVAGNLEAALGTITERVADVLDVERAAVWLLDDDRSRLRCESLYDAATGDHETRATLTAEEYPAYFAALKRHRAIDAADAVADGRTAELADYARQHGIGAMLDATIRDGGEVVGVVCHEHVGDSREWTDDEVRFAAEVSDQVLKALKNHRRRRRERRFRRQKEFLDTVIDSLDDLLYAFGEDGELLEWNERFEEVSGYGPGEIAECTPTDFFEGADADRIAKAIQRIREDRDRVTVQADLVTADGEAIPYEFTGAPMETADEFVGIVGVGRDLSAARSAERRFRDLLDRSPAPALLIDESGAVSYCNDAAADLAGAERKADLLGRPAERLVAPPDRDRIAGGIERLLEGDETGDEPTAATLRALDGTECHVVGQSAPVDGIEGHAAVVVLQDITRRHALEAELSETKDRYQTLVENNHVGIYVLQDRELVYVNPRMAEIFGYEREEMIGRSPLEFTAEADHERVEQRLAAREAGESVQYVFQGVRKDGSPVYVEIQGSQIELDGAPAIIGTAIDVTERRERRRTLERRNEQLEAVSRITSHDLRTPIQVALGRLELARETVDDDYLAEVGAALERTGELVDDLSALAEEGTVDYDTEPVSLREVVESLPAPAPGVTVELAGAVTVSADRAALKRLLENLVKNAAEHGSTSPRSEPPGDVTEGGSADSRPPADGAAERGATRDRPGSGCESEGVTVEIGSLPDDDGFYVADDGPGVPEEEREAVFQPGYSTSDDGSGFGLVSVEQIVRDHGWRIDVGESAAGGARFEISGVESA